MHELDATTMTVSRRRRAGLAATALALWLLLAAAAAQIGPDLYELPGERVFPEGIAYQASAGAFFVGSTSDGTIFRGDIASGEVTVFVEGTMPPFTTIGMTVDEMDRLWVAGGGSGAVRVYDTADGTLLATLQTPEAEATFLNDVAISGDYAYITDSNRPLLFRAPLDLSGIEPWLSFEGTEFEYVDGFNANGIVASADGAYLVVVQTNTGFLYRIDIATKEVTTIRVEQDMAILGFPNGDGLVLDGDILYVVRNADNEIAVIEMEDGLAVGELMRRVTDSGFMMPTTAKAIEGALLVVNSQFNNLQGEPELPFTVVRIRKR